MIEKIVTCHLFLRNYGFPSPVQKKEIKDMYFTAVIEYCKDTGLYVGYVPNFSGAHSQGETLDELNKNLQEVITMLLEDGIPTFESEFIGIQQITVT